MCKVNSNLFSTSQDNQDSPSIHDNLAVLKDIFPFTNNRWGIPGNSSGVRLIISSNQYASARLFWSILSRGANPEPLPNHHGLRVIFDDGSLAIYRENTSTLNSPAIEYTIINQPRVKIHFKKEL